jgi:hypothetical protein
MGRRGDESDAVFLSDAPAHKKVVEGYKATMGSAAWAVSMPVVAIRGNLTYRKQKANGASDARARAIADAQVEDECDRAFGWGHDHAGVVWKIAKKLHGL